MKQITTFWEVVSIEILPVALKKATELHPANWTFQQLNLKVRQITLIKNKIYSLRWNFKISSFNHIATPFSWRCNLISVLSSAWHLSVQRSHHWFPKHPDTDTARRGFVSYVQGRKWSSWKVCCLTIPSTDYDGKDPCACVGCRTKDDQCTAEEQSNVCQNYFSLLAQRTEFTPCNFTEDNRLKCYKYLKHLNTYYTYYINIKLT